ncbi:hypothetical protein KFK09_011618 [Dendrobium nobile]|uniref:Uncharacterized protein n=1 Tax=Dendrobium nobile TaxID=94219 RepID=A0A8T3BD58_DENNO|nr:hypothetical protein KFK09_011618 [Dendrobium nobile]
MEVERETEYTQYEFGCVGCHEYAVAAFLLRKKSKKKQNPSRLGDSNVDQQKDILFRQPKNPSMIRIVLVSKSQLLFCNLP